MRKRKIGGSSDYRIMVLDDELDIVESLSVILKNSGYEVEGFTDPLKALARLREEHFDLFILDFLMEPINGSEVVRQLREFNNELYILLLTGHKELVPPLETIKILDIQAYCEKSDRFDQLLLLVESGIKSVAQKRTIFEYSEGLKKLIKSISGIYQIKPVNDLLADILEEIKPIMKSRNAFILVDDIVNSDETQQKSAYCGIGKYDLCIEDFMAGLSPGFIASIGCARHSDEIVKTQRGVIIPLINEYGKSIGIIYIEGDDLSDRLSMLEIYSKQASISLNNAFLHSVVNSKKEELSRTYDELKNRYIDTVEVLRLAVEAKDSYTKGHSDRVAFYAEEIGVSLGLAKNELEKLRLGGIFHDIGKIGTSDEILLKTTSLDDGEYQQIKRHPLEGAHILSAVSIFKEVVPLVKYHHERVDGKGYPEGLKGEEIPFLARILSVADAFDAMTSDRLYRPKISFEQATLQLRDGAGFQFDSLVVKTFMEVLYSNCKTYK